MEVRRNPQEVPTVAGGCRNPQEVPTVVNPFAAGREVPVVERFSFSDVERMLDLLGLFENFKKLEFISYKDFASFFGLKNFCVRVRGRENFVVYGKQRKDVGLKGFIFEAYNDKWRILLALSAIFSYVEVRLVRDYLKSFVEVYLPERELEEFLNGKFFISHLFVEDVSSLAVKVYSRFATLDNNDLYVFDKGRKLFNSFPVKFVFFCFPYNRVVISLRCDTGEIVVESYESMLEKIVKCGYDEYYARIMLNGVI